MKTVPNFLRISTMDLKIKLLELSGGHYLIIITRGLIDARALEQIFREVATTSQALADCKILIDLADATVIFGPPDIHILVNGLGPDLLRPDIKIAVVSPAEIDEFEQLRVLSASLCSLGLKVAVFDNAKGAVIWLGDGS